jgi:hypothetical protein
MDEAKNRDRPKRKGNNGTGNVGLVGRLFSDLNMVDISLPIVLGDSDRDHCRRFWRVVQCKLVEYFLCFVLIV